MAKISVINSVSWAGLNFSYAPGDTIELDEDVAIAREAEGLVKFIPGQEPKKSAKAGAQT